MCQKIPQATGKRFLNGSCVGEAGTNYVDHKAVPQDNQILPADFRQQRVEEAEQHVRNSLLF